MGCVSSNLLHNEDDHFPQLTSSSLPHHIVSLTSTTYGLLNLDPPPSPSSNPPFTLSSIFPETINSSELMSSLKNHSLPSKIHNIQSLSSIEEHKNSHRYAAPFFLDEFDKLCPPNGENKVVLYTTSLRGVRKTFEDCNVVRAMLEGFCVAVCERDVSMDKGFREELRELMKGKEREATLPPRLFVKGRYIGGAEDVGRIVEDGLMGSVVHGLPKKKAGEICEGCGGGRFLLCFSCNGSSKLVMMAKDVLLEKKEGRSVVRCPDCNENGLVLCPICS